MWSITVYFISWSATDMQYFRLYWSQKLIEWYNKSAAVFLTTCVNYDLTVNCHLIWSRLFLLKWICGFVKPTDDVVQKCGIIKLIGQQSLFSLLCDFCHCFTFKYLEKPLNQLGKYKVWVVSFEWSYIESKIFSNTTATWQRGNKSHGRSLENDFSFFDNLGRFKLCCRLL